MKVKIGVLSMILGFVAMGCQQEEKPKVIYPDKAEVTTVDTKDNQRELSSVEDIRISDLPITMGETDYLLHPVGEVRVYSTGSKYSGKINQYSYTVSNFSPDELTGNLANIMFQHKDSLDIRPLTEQKVMIYSATYLKSIAERYKKHYIVYRVYDKDTNKDGLIDANDIKTLYISEVDGTGFMKLTVDLQEFLDWTVVDAQHRLYFRTVEDINKNGAFDKDDNVNYYYVDLMKKELEVIAYNPLAVKKVAEVNEELAQ
ncbi:hypothetical protein [Myroides pelagicus]|uniref:EF-hand domain-containing protein n=1 Tax=Myroides pelagicus TaxID=270914 RepID=A0A7K1GLW1_9FLAO|nr:hypothetical protein [Myroides pelagicus]MTH29882.1 hypothetical protein [Myroides pelagicus]